VGIVLGFSLFVGVFIGTLISILLVITTVIAAAQASKRRMHVWQVFVTVALLSLPLLIFGVSQYPYDTGPPGSNYFSLFGYSFFVGLAYAVTPAAATVLAFLATLFCPRDYSVVKGKV
jgi:hypothetical protein